MEATPDDSALHSPSGSTAGRWGGRVLTALPVLFMAFDAAIKFARVPEVAEASAQLGSPDHLNPVLGVPQTLDGRE
jgi:hypothetical protein